LAGNYGNQLGKREKRPFLILKSKGENRFMYKFIRATVHKKYYFSRWT
jgi:hypothetical protein